MNNGFWVAFGRVVFHGLANVGGQERDKDLMPHLKSRDMDFEGVEHFQSGFLVISSSVGKQANLSTLHLSPSVLSSHFGSNLLCIMFKDQIIEA